MILYQPLHGTLEDGTEPEAFEAGSILEFIPEIPGDAADARHGNFTVTVRSDMSGEEGTEIVDDQTPHGGYVHLAVDEVGQGTEETVGQRLAVDPVDDDRQRKSRLRLEISLQFIRQAADVEVMQKVLAQHGSAPLVAEYVAQSRRVAYDLLPVIKARISARS